MKIFKKSYVGINHERKDITVAPLAFLVPYEDNAAGRKRCETVNDWANNTPYYLKTKKPLTAENRIIDNVAKSGFKVVDVASRDMTSNKFARIFDPDGFELEISIGNLIDLMLYTVVDHGVIEGELIWARDGAHNRLIPVDSDLYRNALQEGQVLNVTVGDIIIGNHGHEFIYLGTGYVQPVALCGDEVVTPAPVNNRRRYGCNGWVDPFMYGRNNDIYAIPNPTQVTTEKSDQLVHVYVRNNNEMGRDGRLVTRKQPMKATAVIGKPDRKFNENTVYESESYHCYTASGEFIADPYNHKTHTYTTRNVMMRSAPFTADDLDFKILRFAIKK